MGVALVVFGWIDRLAAVDSFADAITTLLLLASGVVIYRIFRERYLFFWIAGWTSYLLYRLLLDRSQLLGYPPGPVALTYIAFLISSALFAAAVFDYLDKPKWFQVVGIAAGCAIVLSLLRAFYWPDSNLLEVAIQVLYRVGTFAAAIKMFSYSRSRRQLSPWLMALMLLCLHIDFNITQPHTHENFDTLIRSLLGLSMLVLLLEESHARTSRLKLVDDITNLKATTQDEQAFMIEAMARLKSFTHAKAVWFRLPSGDKLELHAQLGLSENFRWPYVPANDEFRARMLQQDIPAILDHSTNDEIISSLLHTEGFNHMLVVPVRGKTSVIGLLAIGIDRSRRYKPEELLFLASVTMQIGIAVENQQLISKILRSQRQWANTFDAMPDPILVHDESYSVVRVNRALLGKLGTSLDSVISRRCEEVLPHVGARWRSCPYCGTEGSEFRDAPDPAFGGFSIVSSSSYTGDEATPGGTVHIIRDTTARRAAEERYRTLFDQVQEGVFVSTPEGRVLDCNDAFVQLLGYTRDEVLARDISQSFYVNPADREIYLQRMAKDGVVRNFEVNMRRKDGSIVTALENSYASRTASGNIIRYHGVLLDITEKKRAEDEVRRRNQELEALNTVAVQASQSFDLDEIVNLVLRNVVDVFRADSGSILLLNHETRMLRRCASYGHRPETANSPFEFRIPDRYWEWIHKEHLEVLSESDVPELPEDLERGLRAEKVQTWMVVLLWSAEKMIGVLSITSRRKSAFSQRDAALLVALGRQLANSIEKVRLYEETSKAYENLRRTQEQLLQSEKMSAVGQLISGVAHELNNPLTAILGYAQLLEGEPLSDSGKEFVSKLFKQAQRTQRVVQNLLSFARQRKPSRMPIDVRRILEDTLALRDYDLNLHNIAIDRTFVHSLPAVVADAHQLEQVFLNVINNAVDAMLEKGRSGRLEVEISTSDSQVIVRVRDTGPGIKEVNRIFDPFYTTKPVGKGTGLGLSICYGIIKEHGGDIRAFNHHQGGAVIEILLPTAAGEPTILAESSAKDRAVPLHGRVLIVDDEEAVLDFERDVLAGAGAQVVCSSSAEQAIAAMTAGSFDAVLIDTTMPGALNGIDLLRWIAKNRPELKHRIVLTAAGVIDPELRRMAADDHLSVVLKPFEVSDLIAAAATAIQARKSAATV